MKKEIKVIQIGDNNASVLLSANIKSIIKSKKFTKSIVNITLEILEKNEKKK